MSDRRYPLKLTSLQMLNLYSFLTTGVKPHGFDDKEYTDMILAIVDGMDEAAFCDHPLKHHPDVNKKLFDKWEKHVIDKARSRSRE